MPLHSYEAFDSIISDANKRGDRSLAKEYITLKIPFFSQNTNPTLRILLKTQKNKATFYPIVHKALHEEEYLSAPEHDRPWKLIVMFMIHMSTLQGNISPADQHKLNRSIADLPENCKTFIVGKLENDQEIARLFSAAITDLVEKHEQIPAYLKIINQDLLNTKLNLAEISELATAALDLAKIGEGIEQNDEFFLATDTSDRVMHQFTDLSASSELSSTDNEDSYLDMIERGAMINADWVSLTRELLLENQFIINNKPLMKTLAQHYKQNILDAIRNDETLKESLNKTLIITDESSAIRTADGRPLKTKHALLSLLSTNKKISTTRDFGKTKSSLELCSIMGWTMGAQLKPDQYLNINKNDQLLGMLIEKAKTMDIDEYRKWLDPIYLWEEPHEVKLHIILLTRAQTNAPFTKQTAIIDMLLKKNIFDVNAFITHLLTLAKDPKNWPSLQPILPLTAYLLGKTPAKVLSKENLQQLSHREFKLPFLFAIKNHYDDFSKLIDSKQPNALNAVIDFHQWKPTLFPTTTKTRARIEALKTKNKPPKVT